MDFLFTSSSVPASESSSAQPRVWKFGEFSAVRLVPREAGTAANQHPAIVTVEALRSALAGVEVTLRPGRSQPLFAAAELQDMAPALVSAMAAAGPADDLLLLSTSRREDGFLSTPMSATARLFVQGGALQFIAHDARADVYSTFRAAHVVPTLQFGSRDGGSALALRSAAASSKRADWLALGLEPAAPAATPAAPGATAPAPPRPAPESAPAPRSRDAAFFDEQEQRLKGLKRLRDQGLISEEEYESKRRDILRSL